MNKIAKNCVLQSPEGEIILGYGQYEIKVKIDETPCKVSLNITSPCNSTPVCHGDVNKIGVTIIDNGFILQADIKTNTCCIEWYCDVD